MQIHKTLKLIGILLLLLSACPIAICAQTVEVGGAVEDPSGAAIAKASVEFRNQDTGIRWQTKTNRDGLYSIGEIDPGKYGATVEARGFKTLTRENIAIQAGSEAKIDFKMEAGVEAHGTTVDRTGPGVSLSDIAENAAFDRQPMDGIRDMTQILLVSLAMRMK